MTRRTLIWTFVGVAVFTAGVIFLRLHNWRPRSITLQGAVIRRDDDPRRELPITDAQVTVSDGVTSASTQSDASGYFKVTYPVDVWPGRLVVLSFRHADYQPLDLSLELGIRLTTRQLYVAHMVPTGPENLITVDMPRQHVVSNIRVRYTENSEAAVNVGTAVRTFEVVNKGNVACRGQTPCSPDGAWKAGRQSLTLDAGQGNEFRDVRASCIAGPCPFTRVDLNGFTTGDRTINVSGQSWSDTATFLVEAEVYRVTTASNVRESFPVVFGRTLNFSLPPTQEGVSLEAEVDGTQMVFPLGPELYLSWAVCTARADEEQKKSTIYRCELKPGYRF